MSRPSYLAFNQQFSYGSDLNLFEPLLRQGRFVVMLPRSPIFTVQVQHGTVLVSPRHTFPAVKAQKVHGEKRETEM